MNHEDERERAAKSPVSAAEVAFGRFKQHRLTISSSFSGIPRES